MKLSEILKNVNITGLFADADLEISALCYDSRRAVPGCLFIAMRGFESDGHDFVAAAVERGAACVLCERAPEVSIPYAISPDTRAALAIASAEWFGNPAEKLRIIGVTGTNGKTTTTHLIKEMLEKLTGQAVGMIGTIHNMIGDAEFETERTTPEALELHELFAKMVAAGCEYVVMEVSSHALVLGRVTGVRFEVGVFTNLTQDHLDFHGTMEEYARAKALIFGQSDVVAVNIDDEQCERLAASAPCRVFTYSAYSDAAQLVAKLVKLHPDRVEFCALMVGVLERTSLAIPGMFSVYNALSALSVMYLLDYALGDCAVALTSCHGVKGRAEVVPTGRDFTVIIDYAHTPDALKNIISTMRACTEGRVMTLFGCGGDRDRTKRPIMGATAAELSDFVIVTTDNPRTEQPEWIIDDILRGMDGIATPKTVIEDRREAIEWALSNAKAGDTVILAGKGHETYQTIGRENAHFDEREVVAQAIEGQKR